MSVMKTITLSVLIGIAGARMAQADPLLTNREGSWSFWSSTGNSVKPALAKAEVPPPPPPTLDPVPVATPVPPAPSTSVIPQVAAASTFSRVLPVPKPIPEGSRADAYLNFGTGPYPDANLMLTTPAQPWYTSPAIQKYFGGTEPNAQQRADFSNTVLAHVQKTYELSGGLAPKITLDPTVPTSHTMSVVSGTAYQANTDAVGITNVGNNGFSFADKLAFGSTLEDYEWAVAHNIAHELMHAFGVAGHDDESGHFLDAAVGTWDVLTSPTTRFSDTAIADIRERAFGPNFGNSMSAEQLVPDMEVLATTVPEPTTWAIWGIAAVALGLHRRRQRNQVA